MYNTTSYIFILCTWLPSPPTSSESTDLLLHFTMNSCIPFHCWSQPSPSNKAVAFDLQNPWVKQYGVPFMGTSVMRLPSQPYNCSILNSFQIQSRLVIYWWLEREKPFVSEQIYFSPKLRPPDFNFISSAAAKSKDDAKQCLFWARQNSQYTDGKTWHSSFVGQSKIGEHFLLSIFSCLRKHLPQTRFPAAGQTGSWQEPQEYTLLSYQAALQRVGLWGQCGNRMGTCKGVWKRVGISWPHHINNQVMSWVPTLCLL